MPRPSLAQLLTQPWEVLTDAERLRIALAEVRGLRKPYDRVYKHELPRCGARCRDRLLRAQRALSAAWGPLDRATDGSGAASDRRSGPPACPAEACSRRGARAAVLTMGRGSRAVAHAMTPDRTRGVAYVVTSCVEPLFRPKESRESMAVPASPRGSYLQ